MKLFPAENRDFKRRAAGYLMLQFINCRPCAIGLVKAFPYYRNFPSYTNLKALPSSWFLLYHEEDIWICQKYPVKRTMKHLPKN